jgi:hypothetical protein
MAEGGALRDSRTSAALRIHRRFVEVRRLLFILEASASPRGKQERPDAETMGLQLESSLQR